MLPFGLILKFPDMSNLEKWINRVVTIGTAVAVAVQYIIAHWTWLNLKKNHHENLIWSYLLLTAVASSADT